MGCLLHCSDSQSVSHMGVHAYILLSQYMYQYCSDHLVQALYYKKYSTASDIWSFGAVMYEIWSLGHKPFEAYKNPEV